MKHRYNTLNCMSSRAGLLLSQLQMALYDHTVCFAGLDGGYGEEGFGGEGLCSREARFCD